MSELKELFKARDGIEPIQCCEFSPGNIWHNAKSNVVLLDGSRLAIGSRDNFVYIYTVNDDASEVTKVGKCSGHSSYITHIDWSKDGQYLRSNSGDYEVLFWNMEDCKQVNSTITCCYNETLSK